MTTAVGTEIETMVSSHERWGPLRYACRQTLLLCVTFAASCRSAPNGSPTGKAGEAPPGIARAEVVEIVIREAAARGLSNVVVRRAEFQDDVWIVFVSKEPGRIGEQAWITVSREGEVLTYRRGR